MSDYLSMGGYAAFVWPAFALSFAVLASLLAVSLKALRESEKALDDAGASKNSEDRSA